MKYCKACGKEIEDDTRYCPSCGTEQYTNATPDRVVYREVRVQDEEIGVGAIVLAILGFIIPFIGLIGGIAMLAAGKSKSAGIIAVSTVIGFIFWFFFWGY
jgi:Predicted membrane protein